MKFFQRFFTLLILLAILCSRSEAQITPSNQGYSLIFPKSGDGFAANILRIEKDSLILFTTDYKYVAKKDIGKIILHAKKESGKGFTIGSILGMYAMNYWLGTANGQPGGFLWDELYGNKYNTTGYYSSSSPLGVIGIALLGIGIGGGLGYLTDLGSESNSEMVFLFGGTPEMQEDEWTRVVEALEHKTNKRKFHVGISGGLVFPNISNPYRDQLSAAGYNTNSPYFSQFFFGGSTTNLTPYQNLQGASDFNWLRSISLGYSITDNIQAGVCYALLGEPSFAFSNNTVFPASDSLSTLESTVGQRLEGKGYYATASYNTFFGKNEDFEVIVTGGAGIANMSFDLNGAFTTTSRVSGSPTFDSTQTDNFSIHKTYFSAMVGASLSYYLYDAFSLGLRANYFFVGSATAKAMPSLLLHEQVLNFGNADVGFTIGLHF